MAAVLKGLREKIRQQVGSIRDPDTGEFPYQSSFVAIVLTTLRYTLKVPRNWLPW